MRQKLWRGMNPFESFPEKLFKVNLQGWNSQHEYLGSTIEQLKPSVVIEVGVWKGGSTIFMADNLRSLGLDGVVIAVDTWLGAWDHWVTDPYFSDLSFIHAPPPLFYVFATNVMSQSLQN